MTSQRIDSSARDRRSVGSVLRRSRVLLVAAALLIAGSPPAMATYWNAFNIEGESAVSAQIVTYATLADMLGDVNRTGVFTPNPLGFGVNIVGGGSDGSAYWNVFNIEGESAVSAQIVTYATLADMLGDVNRTGVFTPNPLGFGVNIVGSGADILVAPPPPGAIPEPATIGLLGSALLTLALARRRRVIGVERSG